MAHTGQKQNEEYTGSPTEYFDPLEDNELQVYNNRQYDSEEEEGDEEYTSTEMDIDRFNDLLGKTPPVNTRGNIRDKQIKRSVKVKTEKKESERIKREKIRSSRRNVSINMCDIQVESPVSDDGNAGDGLFTPPSDVKKRKDNYKTFKTSRAYERDLKLSSTDLRGMAASYSDAQGKFPLEVDSPNRFMSLNSKRRETTSRSPVRTHRSSVHSLECPTDRLEFHRTFSILVTMGVNKEKDKKNSPYSRQMSSEQEVWHNRLFDLIWLELQAWQKRRSMEEQDHYLVSQRENVVAVLKEMSEFKVDWHDTGQNMLEPPGGMSHQCSIAEETEPMVVENENHAITKQSSSDMETDGHNVNDIVDNQTQGTGRLMTPKSGQYLHNSIEKQKIAIIQVTEALNKLEKVERLYPTQKALGKDHHLYIDEHFQQKINTLCLWLNITKDLAHKLQLIQKILVFDNATDVDWPWLDFEFPKLGLDENDDDPPSFKPNGYREADISLTDESSYENEDSETSETTSPEKSINRSVSKNVKFDLGPSESTTDMELNDPPHSSTPKKAFRSVSSNSSISRTSSTISLEDLDRRYVYRRYADQTLKRTGLRKLLRRFDSILRGTLYRARQALEKPEPMQTYADVLGSEKTSPDHEGILSSSPSLDILRQDTLHMETAKRSSLAKHGVWSDSFNDIGLPSFKPSYLFLVRIPLDVLHECLKLRLDQRPEEPSILSVKQLIRECKEVLRGAVMVKQYYQQMVSDIIQEEDGDADKFEVDIEDFEEDMINMLGVYFNYIQAWMLGLQNLPEMSKRLKNALEEEWQFTKEVCPYIRGGEADAGNKFCMMARSLLQSIADFLETGMDKYINQYTSAIDTSHDENEHKSSRHAIMQGIRELKTHFHESRERASKALGFAKMLRKDLEISADFNIACDSTTLLEKLKSTKHVRLMEPQDAGYLMFIPEAISKDRQQILQLLKVSCGREDSYRQDASSEDGYLLLVNAEGVDRPSSENSPGRNIVKIEYTAETTIALSHVKVEGVLLIVICSSLLISRRKEFEKSMGDVVQLVNEQTSCHQAITDSLAVLKETAVNLGQKVAESTQHVTEKLDLLSGSEMDEVEKINTQKVYIEILHQCYNFGFEYHKEVTRLVSGDMKTSLGYKLVEFAKQWMKFVTQKCEKGRGLRPRWANQGLDFLITACEPKVLALLTAEEFDELKKQINNCITHVIGDKNSLAPASPVSAGYRVGSPDITRPGYFRNMSDNSVHTTRQRPGRHLSSAPVTPNSQSVPNIGWKFTSRRHSSPLVTYDFKNIEEHHREDASILKSYKKYTDVQDKNEDGAIYFSLDKKNAVLEPKPPMELIREKIHILDQKRTDKLYRASVIGRVTHVSYEQPTIINFRKVAFKWQRGIKIGEGQFGKVYTAVNVDTGELMAMKEVQINYNDHQMVKQIAKEIQIVEGIKHPNLVRYYGFEVHRDEMLIFMEYCAEGTLEDVARAGLDEPMIRKYTYQILHAIRVLHENQIVHRDVKGANIFLTRDGLKLGDFGCSVRLQSTVTMPGELNTMAGTAAYMAPEVITGRHDVGGRSSDIWSVGCVVIEMVTGKRPWPELENRNMIMFKVGMGGCPTIPDALSCEGKDFLSNCLVPDARKRWTADKLLDHQFVKVDTDEDEGQG